MVVCSLTTAYTHYAGALAIRFLSGVLLERRDPVELLHERDPSDPAQTQQDFQWATHAVFARYTSWEPTPINFQRHDPRNPLRLDRVHARAQVVEQVSALVDGSKRRVEALVAYGHEQTLVEKFSWQATDHLLRRRVAPVATVSLRFPQARTDLYQQLCEDFRRQVCTRRATAPLAAPSRAQVSHHRKASAVARLGVCGDGRNRKSSTSNSFAAGFRGRASFVQALSRGPAHRVVCRPCKGRSTSTSFWRKRWRTTSWSWAATVFGLGFFDAAAAREKRATSGTSRVTLTCVAAPTTPSPSAKRPS